MTFATNILSIGNLHTSEMYHDNVKFDFQVLPHHEELRKKGISPMRVPDVRLHKETTNGKPTYRYLFSDVYDGEPMNSYPYKILLRNEDSRNRRYYVTIKLQDGTLQGTFQVNPNNTVYLETLGNGMGIFTFEKTSSLENRGLTTTADPKFHGLIEVIVQPEKPFIYKEISRIADSVTRGSYSKGLADVESRSSGQTFLEGEATQKFKSADKFDIDYDNTIAFYVRMGFEKRSENVNRVQRGAINYLTSIPPV